MQVPSLHCVYRAHHVASQNFIQDGSKGEDFNRNLYNSYLDFATIHVYPQSLAIPGSVFDWVDDNYIGSRAVSTAVAGAALAMFGHAGASALPTSRN